MIPYRGRCPRIGKRMREIPARRILNMIRKGDPVRCDHKIILGNLDIGKVDLPTEDGKILIKSIIEIKDSQIYGDINFANALFKNDFEKSVDFTKTIFHGRVNFHSTSFSNGADFIDTEFHKKVIFKESKFYSAVFTEAKFYEYADFMKAEFYGSAIFDGIQFYNYANFVKACFKIVASFHWAFFSDYANFSGARFKKKANFDRTRFKDDVDFRKAIFDTDLSLRESNFQRFHARWDTIKDHLNYDGAVYLSLIKNFKDLEFFEDADSCYYKYRSLAQKDKKWYSSTNKYIDFIVGICNEIESYWNIVNQDLISLCSTYRPFTWIYRFNWSKLSDQISRISCGYGVKLLPIILWLIGLPLIFALFYYIFGGFIIIAGSENAIETTNSTNISLFESVYFSLMNMIGKPPIGFNPIGGWKYIIMMESLLGYILLALFVVVLIKKLIR